LRKTLLKNKNHISRRKVFQNPEKNKNLNIAKQQNLIWRKSGSDDDVTTRL